LAGIVEKFLDFVLVSLADSKNEDGVVELVENVAILLIEKESFVGFEDIIYELEAFDAQILDQNVNKSSFRDSEVI
jgi:hypothetical protein